MEVEASASTNEMLLFVTDLLSQTWANLRANKLRTFLTMFGIVWG